MPRMENSYVRANKDYRIRRTLVMNETYGAAGDVDTEILSTIPDGEYLHKFYLIVHGTISQDGNGSDAVDSMHILNLISNLRIENGADTHVNLSGVELAQLYRMETGHNPLIPDSIAASTGATNTDFCFVIPINYLQPRFRRPADFSYPTAMIRDASITITWQPGAIGDGAATTTTGTARIWAVTERLNRAVIPAEPESATINSNDNYFRLVQGNYITVFATNMTKANKLLQTSFTQFDADGRSLYFGGLRIDELDAMNFIENEYVDDEQQLPIRGDLIDKNHPPEPDTTTYAFYYFPILFYTEANKLSKIIRVDRNLNVNLTATAAAKTIVYKKIKNHTAARLDAAAKVLGFGAASTGAPRTSRRAVTSGDSGIGSVLPIRFAQIAKG